jgi:hypothetical protein
MKGVTDMKTLEEINQIIDTLNKNYRGMMPKNLAKASEEELEELWMAHAIRTSLLITLCLGKGAFGELAEIHGGEDNLHHAFNVQADLNERTKDLRPAINVLSSFDWMLRLYRSGKEVYVEITDDNVYYEWC